MFQSPHTLVSEFRSALATIVSSYAKCVCLELDTQISTDTNRSSTDKGENLMMQDDLVSDMTK